MASAHAAAYVETMDFIFATYCGLIEPMKSFYSERKPLESAEYDVNGDGIKEKYADLAALPDAEKLQKAFRMTYNADIRTKACDALRALLPIATQTNVGVFGNGRFFQHVLSHCYTSPIAEVRDLAARTHAQLDHVIPRYVKRAKAYDYAQSVDAVMAPLAAKLFAGVTAAPQKDVDLVDRSTSDDDLAIAHMLFPHLALPLRQVVATVSGFDAATKAKVIAAYIGDRKTRRDRPGRALESGYPYTFDLSTDFGTYKDLERHRMGTQLRQRFTPTIGFSMPADLIEAGFEGRVQSCVDRAALLYQRLSPDLEHAASYATLHGSKVRWMLGMNDRALMHMIELRTQPAGHISYRKVCQEMHKLVAARSPWRAVAMKFADHGSYESARGDSEAKQRVRELALDSKIAA
jgi:thymidylate synthase ThyX